MKYYLWRDQNATGCDYMIACGQQLRLLDADTREEAIKEVIGFDDDWQSGAMEYAAKAGNVEGYLQDMVAESGLADVDEERGYHLMESVLILETNDVIDLKPILQTKLAEVNAWHDEQINRKKEDKERKQFERLKAKFEDKTK